MTGSFWADGTDGHAIRARPLSWDLQEKVALIPDEDWEKGAEHIAGVIREIEAEFAPSLDQDALHSHSERLLTAGTLHADAAESTGRRIEEEIRTFKLEAPANGLPEGFEAFELLPPVYTGDCDDPAGA